ncbi:MAG: apolipoprotein N-acyltransferase [Syntrophales bacterium]|jgi:apolipoprotein N-acyltransferase|nr:apolipoprotein N-acyltransferase [Syntrophales bacterium]MCK9528232.1 apolipoprotein N-acyltransferase [Syntrophales bacterium]MDX9921380.1 apolipoprotein N-acyltransferase [Syntrophales bacterium]
MSGKTLLPALFSGVLLVLAFPKFNQDYLIWAAFVPLFFALRNARPAEAFRLGLVAGLIFNAGLIYWIVYVASYYGNLPLAFSTAVLALFSLYLAFYTAVFSFLATVANRRGIPLIVAAPPLWTALEYLKSHLFTGFPWENLGYALHAHIYLIQIADITGVFGISFLVILVNAAMYEILKVGTLKRKVLVATAVTGIVAAILFYGFYRTDAVERECARADTISLGLIQGNIEQAVKWDDAYRDRTINIYGEFSRQASRRGAEFILWPETAAPLFFQDVDDNHRAIVALARETGAFLLFGSPSYTTVNGKQSLLNSAWLLSPEGTMLGRYDKTHLVPFGEYVPLRRIFFFVDKLVEGFADFIPGRGIDPLKLNGMAVGVLICYEGIFPEISRIYTLRGADYLVNLTNDGWYGRTSAPHQHMSMLTLRAVENRRSIARAANTGISALVDPLGRVTGKTDLFEPALLTGTLQALSLQTFYTRHGDVFALCSIVMSCVVLLYRRRRS